jgi:flagellar hook assembly protein FlgD
MDVYNSAGELVRQVTNYDFVMPPDFTPGPADIGVKMDIPSLVISNKGDPNTVQLRFGSGVEEYMLWDGKNNFGAAVSSGVYEVKIVIKTETLLITVATGSVTVLKQDSVIMTGLKVVPNPFDGTGPGVELRWETGVTGDVTMYIYNIKGELVRATRGRLEATKLMWDTKTAMGGPASNGIYIAVLQGVSYDGNRGSMKAKVAVNRRTGQ